MVFRDASSKHSSDLYRPIGPTDYLASWIDLLLPSPPLAARAQSVGRPRPTDLLSGGNPRCLGPPRAVEPFACPQPLPGEGARFVGWRHRRKLRRLALEQGDQ